MLGRRPWIYRETQRPAVPGPDVYRAVCKGDSTHFHHTAFSLFPHCLDSSTTHPHTMKQDSGMSTNRSGKASAQKNPPFRCAASMSVTGVSGVAPKLTGPGSLVTLYVQYPQGLFEEEGQESYQVWARRGEGAEEHHPWQLDSDIPGTDKFSAGVTAQFFPPIIEREGRRESPWIVGIPSEGGQIYIAHGVISVSRMLA